MDTSFNRTTVECKSYDPLGRCRRRRCFNRTTVECKWGTAADVKGGFLVLIELQ